MLTKTDSRSTAKSSQITEAELKVLQLVENCFATSPYSVLRKVSYSYHEGVLILRGQVPSFYMKQMAQTIVRNLEEGIQIDNRLKVGR